MLYKANYFKNNFPTSFNKYITNKRFEKIKMHTFKLGSKDNLKNIKSAPTISVIYVVFLVKLVANIQVLTLLVHFLLFAKIELILFRIKSCFK